MGVRRLACCCGCRRRAAGMHDEALDEEAQEAFVFLEQYPVDKKVIQPRIPYIGELPVALYPGRLIIIEGSVFPEAIRMSVNLACGASPTSDLAFHLNPRFDQKVVVRNYRLGNRWGLEETATPMSFPFQRGGSFQLQMISTTEEFMVAVGGRHFCSFTYRLPLIRVQIVQVNGDVKIESLEYKHTEEYPEQGDDSPRCNFSIPLQTSVASITTKPLETPFTGEFLDSFGVGNEVEITGRVKMLPHSFYLNLQKGSQIWPHPTIPFHMNPRFRPGSTGVVCNSWLKGKWGAEQKTPIFQFRPGRPFILKIRAQEDQFEISVDGRSLANFKYRAAPDMIDTIFIQGDVWINDIVVR